MNDKREQNGGIATSAGDPHVPERLLVEEMRTLLAEMKLIHKESARLREQSLAIGSELERILAEQGRGVAPARIEDRRQGGPGTDPAGGRGMTDMAGDAYSIPSLPEGSDRAAAARAGAVHVLTRVNQNLLAAGYRAAEILDAATEFAVDRLLQAVGRADAARYLRYVSDQIDGQEH